MVCFSQVKQHKKEEHGIILGILFEFKSEICLFIWKWKLLYLYLHFSVKVRVFARLCKVFFTLTVLSAEKSYDMLWKYLSEA